MYVHDPCGGPSKSYFQGSLPSSARPVEDLWTGEPPFDLEFPGGRFAVEDLIPKAFAEIDAVTGASRALVRQHALDLLAVNGDGGHATTVLVLVWSRCIVRVTAKGV